MEKFMYFQVISKRKVDSKALWFRLSTYMEQISLHSIELRLNGTIMLCSASGDWMYFCGKKHPNAINTFLAWEEEKLARNALFYNFLIVLLNVECWSTSPERNGPSFLSEGSWTCWNSTSYWNSTKLYGCYRWYCVKNHSYTYWTIWL